MTNGKIHRIVKKPAKKKARKAKQLVVPNDPRPISKLFKTER